MCKIVVLLTAVQKLFLNPTSFFQSCDKNVLPLFDETESRVLLAENRQIFYVVVVLVDGNFIENSLRNSDFLGQPVAYRRRAREK